MKYRVLLILLLAALCIGWAHAAPPGGSCMMDMEHCYNFPSGVVFYISDLPYSSDLTTRYFNDDPRNPMYGALPEPYSEYSGYHEGKEPGDHTVTIAQPGYDPLIISYSACNCMYTFIPISLKKTPPAIKPGAVNFSAAKTTTVPKLDMPTLVVKVPTTTAAQGSGSKIGVSGSQNLGAAAAALAGSSQSGSSQTGSSSGNQQAGSSSGNSQTGSSQAGSGSGSQQAGSAAAGSIAPGTTGTLSVTTTPAGASIFIDGVQRGVSPADIPGLTPGDHTLFLKLDGYTDLSTPVSITAGETTKYNTGLAAAKKSPGFGALFGIIALGAVLCMRKGRSG